MYLLPASKSLSLKPLYSVHSLIMINNMPSIEIHSSPTTLPSSSVIWLHGLGADGNDFAAIVPELNLARDLSVRFIFPHAPLQPVTINQGYVMRAWFDIYSSQIDSKIDLEGIEKSANFVETLIEKEEAFGIPADRIFLAGFSQGAVIALTTMLRCKKRLAGVLALSGYLPFAEKWLQSASTASQQTPVFLAHGTEDPIVPYVLGTTTHDLLKKYNCPVDWHSYTMAHSVCKKEIDDIGKWITQKLLYSTV